MASPISIPSPKQVWEEVIGSGEKVWSPTLVPLGLPGSLSEMWHHFRYLPE